MRAAIRALAAASVGLLGYTVWWSHDLRRRTPDIVAIPPWGRHRLFGLVRRPPPAEAECGGRGFVVGRGAAEAECVCHFGYRGSDCRTHQPTEPSFAISYLMYGEGGVEATVERSIEHTRAALKTVHRLKFVVFHDRFRPARLAKLRASSHTSVVGISLPRHLNGTCTCATYGVLDSHCAPSDAAYRGMALFRAVHQFEHREFAAHTYVIVMDAEAYFVGGDPFGELLRAQAGFGFYAWGATNTQSCMGDVRAWALAWARASGVATAAFEASYGVVASGCDASLDAPAACCGVRVSSFSGDVVAFRTDVMATQVVRRMLRAWERTQLLRDNRSTEQELWPNLFGLLLPSEALHQFSDAVQLHAHAGYHDAERVRCTLRPLPSEPPPPASREDRLDFDAARAMMVGEEESYVYDAYYSPPPFNPPRSFFAPSPPGGEF